MSNTFRILISAVLLLSLVDRASAEIPFEPTSDAFAPDVFPSQRAALTALAHRVSDAVKSNVKVIAADSVSDSNAKYFSDIVASAAVEKSASVIEVNLSLSDQQSHPMSWAKGTIASGRFNATFDDGKSKQSISVPFVEKPWADDWQMFMNGDSSHKWLMSRSTSPATSAEEAIVSARRAARDSLRQLVSTELSARSMKLPKMREQITPNWLNDRVNDSLQVTRNDGILVRDTFVQKFSRPYGDVWQASVLIDASPKVIGLLADSYTGKAEKELGAKATGFVAMLGIVAILGLLYAFINAVTQGYFMWRLRAVALLAAIAGVITIFAIV